MNTLKAKFLVPTLSIIFISICSVVFVLTMTSGNALHTIVDDELNSKVETLKNTIQNYLSYRTNDISVWGEFAFSKEAIQNPLNDSILDYTESQLRLLQKSQDIYQSVNIINREGDVIASSVDGKGRRFKISKGTSPLNLAERDYFIGSMKGDVVLSQAVISKATNSPVVCISAPIKANGEILGVIYAAIDLGLFNKTYILSQRVGKRGYAYICGTNGQFIAHPNSEYVLSINFVEKYEFAKKIIETKNGMLTYDWEGEAKSIAFREVPLTGWIVAIGVEDKDVYHAVAVTRIIGVVALIITLLVTTLIIHFQVKNILRGVSLVSGAIDELATGDISNELQYRSRDEIGNMADSFRTMKQNLFDKSKLAESVAAGDLTVEVPISSEKDILGNSLHQMVNNTSTVIASIQTVSGNVDLGAAQVSDLSSSLSDGAVKCAASIEQISTSMRVIGDQAEENVATAKEVSSLMGEAKSVVGKADSEMETLQAAMKKINSSSEEIGKIIKVIDDIAFQTNLLALNAAVEAARAGSHGKGFAVVADEVRNLASRSAKAAAETGILIDEAIENAKDGSEITGRTVEVFCGINEAVDSVSSLIQKINRGSLEQASGIEQVVAGIEQIEEVIQHTSASSEETASASAELSSLAEQLKVDLSRFKMKNSLKHSRSSELLGVGTSGFGY
jgi:methyl-accepting chemotaxis protein